MRRTLLSTCVIAALLLAGCTAPTPEADLDAAVAALTIVAALPNLTTADRAWISAASFGLTCSATVLARSEVAAQEAVDIAACFVTLPAVPQSDSAYISAGIATVKVFIALFAPAPAPSAVAANATVRGWSPSKKSAYVSGVKTRLAAVGR